MKSRAIRLLAIVTLACGARAAFAQGFAPAFQRLDVSPGASVYEALLADLDGDGASDLVLAKNGQLEVRLSDGQGGLGAATVFSQGGLSIEGLAAGDIDGDGDLDLAGIDRPAEMVGVWLGDGAGGLTALPSTSVGVSLDPSAIDIALGDVDGDGRDDVVLNGANQNAALIMLSSPFGGLGAVSTTPIANHPSHVVLGDLNGDGLLDLVAASPDGIAVRLGIGAGTFAPPQTQFLAGGTTRLDLGDLNSDGWDDVCATRGGGASLSMSVALSLGNGALSPASTYSTSTFARDVVMADVSRDGRLDVCVGVLGAGAVRTFLGDGAGGVSASTVLALPSVPLMFSRGDIDRNGGADIAVSLGVANAGASVLVNLTPAASTGIAYCMGKVNTLGCIPQVAGAGASSASMNSGFLVTASQVRNQRTGLLLYGVDGDAVTPFLGGWLCVRQPFRRTPAQSSGGSPANLADCSGAFALDLNAFAAGLAGGAPAVELSVVGAQIACQFWSRDPGASSNASLSDGWAYSVGP